MSRKICEGNTAAGAARITPIYGSAAGTPLRRVVKPGPQTVTLEIKIRSDK
jgi:hypothetical protein